MANIKPYAIGSEANSSDGTPKENAAPAAAENAAAPAAAEVEVVPVTEEVALVAPTHDSPLPLGSVCGDISPEDIVIPRLSLVQGVGDLAELFAPGGIVLDKTLLLSDGTAPLELTVLSARKKYIENLPFDADSRPNVFNTLEEVRAAGGTIDWVDDQQPSYVPLLQVHVIFRAPEGSDYAYPLEFEGQPYGLAIWTMRGVAYNRAGRNILTAASFALRDGLFNGKWQLTTKREKFGRNSIVVPVLRNVGRNTPEFVDFLRNIG